ncbi:putative transposase like protein [Trichonephila clavipes]|nr:putative transposase like protein [Trichonephila clavipes]
MGKKIDFSICKKAEVNSLVNVKLFSNREISRKLKVSEASVRRIKKKIESGEELSPKRKKHAAESLFSPQGQKDLLRKFALKTDLLPQNDERTFEILQNKTQFVRRRDGEKFHSDCVVQTVKHPTKIMIWSVISGKGTGRLDGVKARSIKAFLAEQNIPLLDCPGNSSDMNPIENIWELMKREVAKDAITNKTQLLERIIHVCNHHPQMQETVQSSIDSMPRRIEALIAAKGGSTKY